MHATRLEYNLLGPFAYSATRPSLIISPQSLFSPLKAHYDRSIGRLKLYEGSSMEFRVNALVVECTARCITSFETADSLSPPLIKVVGARSQAMYTPSSGLATPLRNPTSDFSFHRGSAAMIRPPVRLWEPCRIQVQACHSMRNLRRYEGREIGAGNFERSIWLSGDAELPEARCTSFDSGVAHPDSGEAHADDRPGQVGANQSIRGRK